MMLEKFKLGPKDSRPHTNVSNMKISICVRKRPIFTKEEVNGEIDAVSASNPKIRVHECKFRVDGITKFVENHDFLFDNTYSDNESSEDLYRTAIQPNIHFPFNKGIVTCFAYGQTGSGKTFTMKGSNESAICDLFALAKT
jgi:kinesin family protein 2/24